MSLSTGTIEDGEDLEKSVLVYDAGCGPCTRFKQLVEFLDARGALAFLSLADADAEGMPDDVSPSRRHRSFHLVSPGGGVLSGAEALPTLISLLPAGRVTARFIVAAPGGVRALEFGYSALSRLHDAGRCHYTPDAGRPPLGGPGRHARVV